MIALTRDDEGRRPKINDEELQVATETRASVLTEFENYVDATLKDSLAILTYF